MSVDRKGMMHDDGKNITPAGSRPDLTAPGYTPSERDKAVAAAREILASYAKDNFCDQSKVVARFLLRTLGMSERA